jgi:drug/metabolite transporter (DMT)-like permease
VVFNGSIALQVKPKGDMLALLAAVSWAVYGILLRHWSGRYNSVLITRKVMFYGILTVLPLVIIDGTSMDFSTLFTWENGVKLAYLGLVGSALCYLFWGSAVKKIGVLTANLYIYVVPLVTLLVSVVALNEKITAMGATGIVLVIAGMIFGTKQRKSKEQSL